MSDRCLIVVLGVASAHLEHYSVRPQPDKFAHISYAIAQSSLSCIATLSCIVCFGTHFEKGHIQERRRIITSQLPTCPILYKLCSQLFFMRLQPTLDTNQSVDQAGFRLGLSTTGQKFTFQQLREREREKRAAERHQPLWVAAVDAPKNAFDTVEHSSVRRTVREQGIEETSDATHKSSTTNTSNGHTDVKTPTITLRARNQTGRPTHHAFVQLTLAAHRETSNRKVEQQKPRRSDSPSTTTKRTSPTSGSSSTLSSSPAHSNTRPPGQTKSPQPQQHTAFKLTPKKTKTSSPTRDQKNEKQHR